jgi:hypothetical protein
MGAAFVGGFQLDSTMGRCVMGEKIVLFMETVGSCCFVAGYWAATRTSTGSGSSVIARVGLAKV